MLGEIVAQEKQSETILERRRDETSSRLQGMRVADKARSAYVAGGVDHGCQLDLSSER
jgi:hypothetical protein